MHRFWFLLCSDEMTVYWSEMNAADLYGLAVLPRGGTNFRSEWTRIGFADMVEMTDGDTPILQSSELRAIDLF